MGKPFKVIAVSRCGTPYTVAKVKDIWTARQAAFKVGRANRCRCRILCKGKVIE